MRDATLPAALLAISLGLSLAAVSMRIAAEAIAALIITAIVLALLPTQPAAADLIFSCCWISILICAALVHVSRFMDRAVWSLLGVNAGIWIGLLCRLQGGFGVAWVSLPLTAIYIPAAYIHRRHWGIALKVVASWLIAIAALELALTLVPTPGYKPDHMD